MNRRQFIGSSLLTASGICLRPDSLLAASESRRENSSPTTLHNIDSLPKGSAPAPVPLPHFPDRLHAFVWRNWPLVPVAKMARVLNASPGDVLRLGKAMGLSAPPRITREQQRRSYLTVIRRNWHLLPYEQLLQLLDWTPEQMAFTLREDDFLYIKLGNLKPQCEPLQYQPPDAATREREQAMARIIREAFPEGVGRSPDPLFSFVSRLSEPPKTKGSFRTQPSVFSPRFCYSYFALYGDPLLEPDADPYPDGFLARLADAGVNGVWLQAVLSKLAPFPWDPKVSAQAEERLANLRKLVRRARRHGIGIYLYLNEPRALPLAFYQSLPHLKGVVEGDHATLCTSQPEVQRYLSDAVTHLCRAVPDLAGLFTISGSENLTHCWSHGNGGACPRCGKRPPAEVIAELHGLFHAAIQKAGAVTQLLAWDWGWADAWVPDIIQRLPSGVALMSVSEWSIPIRRGGVETTVGEYSISTIGPGPRATRHWELARQRGLKTIAKVQVGNTWELSAVPYIPALENVARHALNLRKAKVDGLMLGWTLGGYPSPNLEAVAEAARRDEDGSSPTVDDVLQRVAQRRFGSKLAPTVRKAWHEFSAAFSEFPFHGGLVYCAPMQYGPTNLFWAQPTGYRATMIGFPYDDLDGWRAVYPPPVFIAQFEKIAAGFERGLSILKDAPERSSLSAAEKRAWQEEIQVAEAAAIHFRTTANQARFVQTRQALAGVNTAAEATPHKHTLEQILREEIRLAQRLHEIQCRDSRIGFEASNQYYYVPVDLAEKVLNCHDLLTRWLLK